jgi:Glycosyl hydrolase family 9
MIHPLGATTSEQVRDHHILQMVVSACTSFCLSTILCSWDPQNHIAISDCINHLLKLHFLCVTSLSQQGLCFCADNLKVTSAIAVIATYLAWGILESPTGFGKAEVMDQAMAELKWAADYLIACQTGTAEYVALVRANHGNAPCNVNS